MRALHFPNPRALVGMRVVCVRPRPKISFGPPTRPRGAVSVRCRLPRWPRHIDNESLEQGWNTTRSVACVSKLTERHYQHPGASRLRSRSDTRARRP
eukprot:4446612-Prymnesium_polylepis.2